MDCENYNVSEIVMPTYLQSIFRSTDLVTLISNNTVQFTNGNGLSATEKIKSPKGNELHEEDLELTGNPLEVDLKGDDDIEVSFDAKRQTSWTQAETEHYPLDKEQASLILMKNKNNSNGQVVCLCDGKDPQKTITLGVWKQKLNCFPTLVVRYLGGYRINDEAVSFARMLQKHSRLAPDNVQPKVTVTCLYPIIGFHKRRAQDVQNTNVSNSAFLEAMWNDMTYTSCGNQLKLYLQVNSAHADSLFHPLWQQLNLLDKFIELLQEGSLEETTAITTVDPLPFYQANIEVHDLLSQYETNHFIPNTTTVDWQTLNVLDMRSEDFLEKLWSLLIRLDFLENVREIFYKIFEYMVDDNIRYTVSTSTTIGCIIKGLIDGTVAIPTLTLSMTLKFLVELGVHKLHKDYQFLVGQLDAKRELAFDEAWTHLLAQAGEGVPAFTKGPAARKSRVSMAKGGENAPELRKQLDHIARLHLCAEFMHLASDCKLQPMDATQVNEFICTSSSLTKSFKMLRAEPVVDLECHLYTTRRDLLFEKLRRVYINVRFHSEDADASTVVTSIYHLSDAAIYPPSVFNDYDLNPGKSSGTLYFVHEAIIVGDTFKIT